MSNIIFPIVCLTIMLVYNAFVLIKYKQVPESLSNTAYLIGSSNDLKRYWFTLYCILTAFTILPALFKVTVDGLEFIPFLLCAGLLFAGFSPSYKDGIEKPVHYVSAYISFGSFLIYGLVCMHWGWLLSYSILLIGLCIWKRQCYVYFAEVLALVELCIWLIVC